MTILILAPEMGLDEFRTIPDRWYDEAITLVGKHVAEIGPSNSALAIIHADRLAAINN